MERVVRVGHARRAPRVVAAPPVAPRGVRARDAAARLVADVLDEVDLKVAVRCGVVWGGGGGGGDLLSNFLLNLRVLSVRARETYGG